MPPPASRGNEHGIRRRRPPRRGGAGGDTATRSGSFVIMAEVLFLRREGLQMLLKVRLHGVDLLKRHLALGAQAALGIAEEPAPEHSDLRRVSRCGAALGFVIGAILS